MTRRNSLLEAILAPFAKAFLGHPHRLSPPDPPAWVDQSSPRTGYKYSWQECLVCGGGFNRWVDPDKPHPLDTDEFDYRVHCHMDGMPIQGTDFVACDTCGVRPDFGWYPFHLQQRRWSNELPAANPVSVAG